MRRIDTVLGTDGASAGTTLPKVELVITRGRAAHRVREVRGAAFLIGAADECDLVLGDQQFGLLHSYLFVSPDRVAIRHLGSGPGLNVSGQPVTWAALCDDDQLQTGPYEFRVRIDWPAGSAELAARDRFDRRRLLRADEEDRPVERLLRDIDLAHTLAPRLELYVESDPARAASAL